ncbi:hypothetical protein RFI_17399 [Reticulomyxa filosa]|uniref:Uncharacterized protein n=1 Tax=Reticulomyxa filosa TaxID=46433 RepID=X6N3E3_RETFI|nr:hypothetical protein RFI_17399 [Reticulomyxa filosa]|eukprot:ETO19827.1 hypothetical protein RFI_17399 [Reticulomyxa filosa]
MACLQNATQFPNEYSEQTADIFYSISGRSADSFEYNCSNLNKAQKHINEVQQKMKRTPNCEEFLRYLRSAFEEEEEDEVAINSAGMYAELAEVYHDARELAMQLKAVASNSQKLSIRQCRACIQALWMWIEEKGFQLLDDVRNCDDKCKELESHNSFLTKERNTQITMLKHQQELVLFFFFI